MEDFYKEEKSRLEGGRWEIKYDKETNTAKLVNENGEEMDPTTFGVCLEALKNTHYDMNEKRYGVEIVVDHSPEYGRMRVYSKLKQQMNAHAIYRGMNIMLIKLGIKNRINIFKWDGQKDIIHEVNISDYLSQFMAFKTQFDVNEMTKISNIKRHSDTTKDIRKKRMGYTNNQLRMLLGYLDQVSGKGRNTFIMQNYYKIF